MAQCVVTEKKMVGLPCSEPPSPPLSGSSPPNAALLKSVPFWEMLHLPAQHFPAENASSLQPFQLTVCGCTPFWGNKPERAEKSYFLARDVGGTWLAGLGWGAIPQLLAKAHFGHLDLDVLSLGHPRRGPGSPGACRPPPPPAWEQEAVAGPLWPVPAIWLRDQRENRLANA